MAIPMFGARPLTKHAKIKAREAADRHREALSWASRRPDRRQPAQRQPVKGETA